MPVELSQLEDLLLEPRLAYPTRETFRTTLAESRKLFSTRMLNAAARVAKSGGNHDANKFLMPVVNGLFRTLSRYADLESISGRVPWSSVVAQEAMPSFGELTEGPLASVLTDVITWAENRLMYEAGAAVNVDNSIEAQERFEWLRTVRMVLASTIIDAVDYAGVWDEIDGDAGWDLAEHVAMFAEEFADRADQVIFHNSYMSNILTPVLLSVPVAAVIDRLRSSASEARRWRHGLQPGATLDNVIRKYRLPRAAINQKRPKGDKLKIKDLGTIFPFEFAPIPAALTREKYDKDIPVQMHWRPQLEHRVRMLFKFWDAVKHDLKLTEYECRLTAGSLKHGGHHPPHDAHRNGAEIDIKVPVPDLALTAEGPLRYTFRGVDDESEDIFDVSADDLDIEQEVRTTGVTADRTSMTPRPPDWRFPSHRAAAEWYLVARKFTQCIYLTCPSSVIYASAEITRQAKEELLERLNTKIQATAQADGMKKALTLLTNIKIEPWKWKDFEEEFKMRKTHRHHWHVNYSCDGLGDISGWTVENTTTAEEVTKVLLMINETGLWKELLHESDGPIQ